MSDSKSSNAPFLNNEPQKVIKVKTLANGDLVFHHANLDRSIEVLGCSTPTTYIKGVSSSQFQVPKPKIANEKPNYSDIIILSAQQYAVNAHFVLEIDWEDGSKVNFKDTLLPEGYGLHVDYHGAILVEKFSDKVFTSSSQKIEDKTRTVFVVDGDTIARFINGEIWPDMLEEYATETILSTQRALAKTEKELIASKKKGVTLEGEVERLTSELRQTVEQMRRMSVEHLRASAQVRAASEEMILASKQALEAMQRTAEIWRGRFFALVKEISTGWFARTWFGQQIADIIRGGKDRTWSDSDEWARVAAQEILFRRFVPEYTVQKREEKQDQ
jgi:hypothetical protein